MKQNNNIAGLYLRLSQEDERQGESLSIENQRGILRKYAIENGFKIHDEYIDDGVSGTTFDRPEVQRLLDDAKTGVIDTIIVKDLSRFGRNYILTGQYIDYIFPAYGIRFIAIQDNIDTANRNSSTMDMMPIMNVFNEWHAANTSKKIRAVLLAHAKDGIYHPRKAPYGYIKGTGEKKAPYIDEEAALIVRRIFEMRASGISPNGIAAVLNAEGIPSPSKYCYEKFGILGRKGYAGLWCNCVVTEILNNPTYLGNMVQHRFSTVSYKNHKKIIRDESEWITVLNTHEPIISKELWDKVQEIQKSVAQGRKTKCGYTHPLSGFLFCADCGEKMKMGTKKTKSGYSCNFDCGRRIRFGKNYCASHYITANTLSEIVLQDIRAKARQVSLNEQAIREQFIKHNAELNDKAIKTARRELKAKQARQTELKKLIQAAYEDKVKGKIPEDVCIEFIEKYSTELKALEAEIQAVQGRIVQTENTVQDVEDFITAIKKYLEVPELTREMCYELIDKIYIGALPNVPGEPRTIEIVYKADISSVLKH